MTIYIDTSALVPLYVPEPASDALLDLLARDADSAVISSWGLVEARSAFALKVRLRALSQEAGEQAYARLCDEKREEIHAVLDTDHAAAAQLIDFGGPALRAGDALHVAICMRLGARLLTLDREMAMAARALDLELVDL